MLEGFRNHFTAWIGLLWFYVYSGKYKGKILSYTAIALLCGMFYAGGYFMAQQRYQEFERAANQIGEELGLEWQEQPWFIRFSMIKREIDVAAKMVGQLKQFLYEKSRDLEDLKEQVYFYKSVIAPEELKGGLSIFSVAVLEPVSDGQYPVEIVLRKMDKKTAIVKGHIKISVYGSQHDEYTNLTGLDKGNIKFSFKYFQKIRGAISLPEGFVPNQLEVVVVSNNFKAFEQKFSWKDIV